MSFKRVYNRMVGNTKLFVRTVFIGLILLTSSILPFARVAAQNQAANGFRISPVRNEFTIKKGDKQRLTVTIENPTNISTIARVVINDFVASDDETGEPRLILDNNVPAPKNSFKTLLAPISDIKLAANEKKNVDFNISVPADASAGGYYGAIRFVPISSSQQSNVGLTASVGSIVLVTVPGDLKEQLKLVQLSASLPDGRPRGFLTHGDVSIVTRLENTGDIHVKPFGKVLVKDMFGHEVGSIEFNNTQPRANILPGSTRKFVDNLPKRKWFGRYTIEANLGYSQGGGDLIIAKANFWYIPTWALIALAVLVLLVVVLVFWLSRRRRSSRPRP